MPEDISDILERWPFDPGEFNVRLITDEQGNQRIQMRIDLGMLQMNMEGRPDGKRPRDCES